jgi:predicted nucleic acid-binding protein
VRTYTPGVGVLDSPLADDVVAAASLSHPHQLSFWDAMIPVFSLERIDNQ